MWNSENQQSGWPQPQNPQGFPQNPGYNPPPQFPAVGGDPGAFQPSYNPGFPGQFPGPQPQGYPPTAPQPNQYGPPVGQPNQYAPPAGPPSQYPIPGQPAQYGAPQLPTNQYAPPPVPPNQFAPPGAPPTQYPPPGPPPGPPSVPPNYPSSAPPSDRGFPGHHGYARPTGAHQGYAPSYAPPPGPPPRYPPPAGNAYPGPPQGAGVHSQQSYGTPHMPPSQMQYYGPKQNQGQPFFQYSQCNGKRKALCIGINYFGQTGELKGCINDARNIHRFLCTHFHYKPENIVMLTDDSQNPMQNPTKQNILQAMQWLVRDARPNDSLFFHYSGHGGQTRDLDGDEADGYDEVIYPVDHKINGEIVDDLMHDIMVKSLPPGCRLTAIFDSCHSGSVLDLPYIYSTEGKIKEPNLAAEAGQGLLSAAVSYAKGDMQGVFKSVNSVIKSASGGTQKADQYAKKTRTSPADVISWSGCKDSQTSADTNEAGSATGAMSFAFMSTLSQNKQQTYQQLLNNIRVILRTKYSQKPQLSSSHPIDTSIYFIC